MKGVKSSELGKESQFVKIYRRRLKAIKDSLQLQQGTGIYIIGNDLIENLYSFLGSRVTGNTSNKVKMKLLTCSTDFSKINKKNDYNTIYNSYLRI